MHSYRYYACKSEKSLALARIQGNVNSSTVAKRTRGLCRSCGGAVRRDVLVATDMDLLSEKASYHATWSAYRRAKKGFAKREDGGAKKAKIKEREMVRP